MRWIRETIESIKSLHRREFLIQLIGFGIIVAPALMIYKILMVITGSGMPVVAVISGSMEPGFKRGDLLFLHRNTDPTRIGDIIVFELKGHDIPIVHRVIKVHERRNTREVDILTKGDNNYMDDRPLYGRGMPWLQHKHIFGKAIGLGQYVGWPTTIINENPILKFIIIGTLGFTIIFSKD